MENPSQTALRLIGALEKLECQEALQAANADTAGVLETRRRITPVVKRIAELGASSLDAQAAARLAAVVARRRRTRQLMARHVEALASDLSRTVAGLRMLAKVIPLYLRRANRLPRRRLCALS